MSNDSSDTHKIWICENFIGTVRTASFHFQFIRRSYTDDEPISRRLRLSNFPTARRYGDDASDGGALSVLIISWGGAAGSSRARASGDGMSSVGQSLQPSRVLVIVAGDDRWRDKLQRCSPDVATLAVRITPTGQR